MDARIIVGQQLRACNLNAQLDSHNNCAKPIEMSANGKRTQQENVERTEEQEVIILGFGAWSEGATKEVKGVRREGVKRVRGTMG
ncbi:hypothetical protein ACLKA6_017102 [Drosophila palustris]